MPDEANTQAPPAPQSIANGQLVRLKSGGPVMTAIILDAAQAVSPGQPKTFCQWFDRDQKLQSMSIATAALRPVLEGFRLFNLNETIRVKLTDHGRAILKAEWDAYASRIPNRGEWKAPEVDADGWTKMQAWVFIRDLGQHMGMAQQLAAETTVAFEERHLKIEALD